MTEKLLTGTLSLNTNKQTNQAVGLPQRGDSRGTLNIFAGILVLGFTHVVTDLI